MTFFVCLFVLDELLNSILLALEYIGL